MAQMSASILRKMAGELVNKNPKNIYLAGVIKADEEFFDSSWSETSDKRVHWLYGFSVFQGLIDLTQYVGKGNRKATPLYQIPDVEKFTFFILSEDFRKKGTKKKHLDRYRTSIYYPPEFKEMKI